MFFVIDLYPSDRVLEGVQLVLDEFSCWAHWNRHVTLGNGYNHSLTEKIDGLYMNLAAAKTMKMKIGDRTMEFALLGVKDGLARVEKCFNGGAEVPEKTIVSSGVTSINPALMPPPPPMGMQTDAVTPVMPQEAIPQVPAEAQAMPEQPETKDAGTAAMVDDMLRSAAEKNGRVKAVAVDQKPAETKKPAAQQQGQALAQAWNPGAVSGAQREIMVPRTDSRLNELADSRTWRAMHGAGLQEVLDVWTSQAHVRLLWMAGRDFPVMKSISAQGTFESAVQGLLEQYQGEDERPVGKIYNDPATGKRVLLVEASGD